METVISSDNTNLLTIKEAANQVGVSANIIYRYVKRNWVKAYQIGPKLLRIPASELDPETLVDNTTQNRLIELRTQGWKLARLCDEFHIPPWRIHRILTGFIPKHQRTYYRDQHIRNGNIVRQRKLLVITHYGNGKPVCVKCGFADPRALSIDHIQACGFHNREFKGQSLYAHLIKNNYPSGYQTLCMNCQWIKRNDNKEFGWKGTNGKKILGKF